MAQDAPTTKIDNSWYFGLFFQDDFRIHPRLTLNLGARWDIQPPITDPHDRFDTFVPGKQSVIVKTAPVGLLFPGDPGVGRGIISTDWNNVSPRVGIWRGIRSAIARRPSARRRESSTAACPATNGTPRRTTSRSPSGRRSTLPQRRFDSVYSISDPYRLLPGGVSPFPYSYNPPTAPRFVPPSAVRRDRSELQIAVQLPDELRDPAAGGPGHQHHGGVRQQPDAPHPGQPGPELSDPDGRRPTPATSTTAARTCPEYLSSVGLTKSILNSAYHGLQITGDKRLSHNFQVKGFYTFGKSLDYINTQNSTQQTATDWNNIALDRGRTNNDRRHNVVISGIWELKYFRDTPAFVRADYRRLVALDALPVSAAAPR